MKVQVVLHLNSRSNAEVLVFGDHVTTCMTGNPNFGAVDISSEVMVVKTVITNLRTAMNAATSDTKTDAIKIARDAVNRHLTKLASKVEDMANDPSVADNNRVNIVHSAGMEVKNQTHHQKHVFTVDNGLVSGSVVLSAEGGAKSHEWQYTTDIITFAGRVAADTTTTAKTEITGLTRATEYAFFHKAIVVGERTDWEGPVLLVVV